MRQRAAASLLYQSKYAEAAFRNLLKLIFLKIVGRILAFYIPKSTSKTIPCLFPQQPQFLLQPTFKANSPYVKR